MKIRPLMCALATLTLSLVINLDEAHSSMCAPDPVNLIHVTLPEDENVAPGESFLVYHDRSFALTVRLDGKELSPQNTFMPAKFVLPLELEPGSHALDIETQASNYVAEPSLAMASATYAFTVGTPLGAEPPPAPVILGLATHYTNDDLCGRIDAARVYCPELPSELYDVVIEEQRPDWFYALECGEENRAFRRGFLWPGECPVIIDLGVRDQRGCCRVVAISPDGQELAGPSLCALQPPLVPTEQASRGDGEERDMGCSSARSGPVPMASLLASIMLFGVRRRGRRGER